MSLHYIVAVFFRLIILMANYCIPCPFLRWLRNISCVRVSDPFLSLCVDSFIYLAIVIYEIFLFVNFSLYFYFIDGVCMRTVKRETLWVWNETNYTQACDQSHKFTNGPLISADCCLIHRILYWLLHVCTWSMHKMNIF